MSRVAASLFRSLEHVPAVEAGEDEIERYGDRAHFAREVESFFAVAGANRQVAGRAEGGRDQRVGLRVVLDHQHSFCARLGAGFGGASSCVPLTTAARERTGSVNENVLPLPGELSTRTQPPWSCTNFLTSARPSPVPPNSRRRCRRSAGTRRRSPRDSSDRCRRLRRARKR